MGSVPSEPSLDLRPAFVPKTISNFLKEISLIGSVSDKVSRLDAFVKRLEEERRKIDGFKRELPLCMLLLNDAIVALKEESMQSVGRNVEPVLEEYIPLKNNKKEYNHSEEDGALISIKREEHSNNNNCNYNKDKKNWMSSVQLWKTDGDDYRSIDHKPDSKRNDEDPFQGCKNRGRARAFIPFKGNSGLKEEKREIPVHGGLTLLIPGTKNLKAESGSMESRTSCSRAVSCSSLDAQVNCRSGPQLLSDQQQQQQIARKQRRCWSSELHRRFVNALQQLGGSQVATPKQIRELMQVDGLTNDEVKSHLQKYRLHTRRLPPSMTTPANQSVVVSGNGLWISQDQYGDSSKTSSSQSGSPQGPLQLGTNTGGTSTTGGDSTEDDNEDAKSEGYSWKSHVRRPGNDDV